jgi:hypothetical protein
MTFGFFEHNDAFPTYKLPDGKVVMDIIKMPRTYKISERFQIRDGAIDSIEAVVNTVPCGMTSEVWAEK